MIEAARKPFAIGDGQIELELVGAAAGRIGPGGVCRPSGRRRRGRPAFPFRLDPRGAVEKPRKLGERDRMLVVEVARRMTLAQQLCDRREWLATARPKTCADRFSCRASAAAPPAAAVSRRHRDKVRPADWPAGLRCCGCGTEDRESPRARGCRRPRSARRPSPAAALDLEQDLAIQQQGEKLDPGKAVLPPELADLLRRATAWRGRPRYSGSQILNSAPARGNSSTISLPRRRR